MIRFGRLVSPALLALSLVILTGCPVKNPAGTSSGAQEATTSGDTPLANSDITAEDYETLVTNFERVHFAYDNSELDEISREVLAANAAILVEHPELTITVEGHADRWGSDIYNLALGQRRAESVRSYLLNMGVLSSQLQVISFGEERPIANEGDRDAEAPNRRAEFLVKVQVTGTEVGSSY